MNPIKKPMDDIEDEDIDLDEILREMGIMMKMSKRKWN